MSAPTAAPEPPPNLLHVQFKNPEYLSYLSHLQATGQVTDPSSTAKPDPAHPLTEYNVMSYFATSPFFDRRSNNEQIRMQNIANGLAVGVGMGARQEEQELKRFTGLEFVLVHARAPACFVVQKRWRSSPSESTPLAAYYIINDSIYQAPDLYSVLATRLQSTVYGLKTSLSTQRRARPSFDPRRGHHGRFIVPDPAPSDTSTGTRSNAEQDPKDDAVLQDEEEADEDDDHNDDDDDIDFEDVTAQPTPTAPVAKRARFD
ncbi:hypothetical protein EX895_000739 [Sporisorium graminicola]|uniref:Mediator of RNA polymerase II transcription subunit 6 n=1 Tax=Sporisorium graminicola TaxID=280036 RepID=A0A4U7L0J7_9BASI|nr:hypothetical protein EX895_000739 [Sporisorium graminicola]TKY90741.1 hypothetical protein EX895_000739 [Sporisorium graminicola]